MYSGAKILFLVEDGHTHWSTEAKLRDGRLKILPASGSMPERQRSEGALSRGERAGGQCFPSPPSVKLVRHWEKQLQMLQFPYWKFSLKDHLQVYLHHPASLVRKWSDFAAWQMKRTLFLLFQPSFSSTGVVPAGASSKLTIPHTGSSVSVVLHSTIVSPSHD